MYMYRLTLPLTRAVACTAVLLLALVQGCSTQPAGPKIPTLAEIPEIYPGILAGYLPQDQLPDSLSILPPPPLPDSPAYEYDVARNHQLTTDVDPARWALAAADADLHFPAAAAAFDCALGARVTPDTAPNLYVMMRRTLADAALATYTAKNAYRRQRPFMVNGGPICTPQEREVLSNDGSYPSGHTAYGWAWALILAEVAPERGNVILARGLQFGESRAVCNVHWPSDVAAGRTMGAAAVARMHDDPVFSAQLDAAKAEWQALEKAEAAKSLECNGMTPVLATP